MEAVTNFDPSYDGIDDKDNELISQILSERIHTLPEEDIKILEKRDELLKTEYHTLQNASYENICDDQRVHRRGDHFPTADASLTRSNNEPDEALPEFLVDPNHEEETVDFNNTVTNFIHDENVRAQIISLNQQIESNMSKCRKFNEEAKALFLEKMNLQRELRKLDERIVNYSAEDAKVRKIKKKKGTDSADTGIMKRTSFCRFGIPYFKSKERFPAYMNADQREMVRSNQFMMMKLPRVKRFSGRDAQIFDRDVLKHLKAKRIEQLKRRLKSVAEKEKERADDNDLFEEKRNLQRALEETENVKSVRETLDWNIKPDFNSMVSTSQRFDSDDYKRLWHLIGSSALSRDEFSDEETGRLKRLVTEYGAQDWDAIADMLQTNRSGFTCFTRYMSTQKKGVHLPWTPEEDDLLLQMGSKLSSMKKAGNRYHFWKNIRRQFPHRSYAQIHSHWTYVLEPSLKKGRFTAEEHDQMERLLKEGKSIPEIAKIVQNRSVAQIRAHFEKPYEEPNHGRWTSEEKKRLVQLVEKHGTRNWVQISKEMKTRTRVQCRLKYLTCYQKYVKRNVDKVEKPARKTLWTAGEEESLRKLIREHGTQFGKISAEMKTKTAGQCRWKYRQLRKKAGVKAAVLNWRKHEVELFKDLLKKYGRDFVKISEEMESKNVEQCQRKYEQLKETRQARRNGRVASDSTNRSPGAEHVAGHRATGRNWTEEEIRLFAELAKKHGPQFRKISQELRTKSVVQCRAKYKRMVADSAIAPSSNVSRYWSLEDVALFRELLRKHGRQFRKISEEMGNKSRHQCIRMYAKVKDELDFELPTSDAGGKAARVTKTVDGRDCCDRDEPVVVGPADAGRIEVADERCEKSESTRHLTEVTFVDVRVARSPPKVKGTDDEAKVKKNENVKRLKRQPNKIGGPKTANRTSQVKRRGRGARSKAKTEQAKKIEKDTANDFNGFSVTDVASAVDKTKKIRVMRSRVDIDINSSAAKECTIDDEPRTKKIIEIKKDRLHNSSETRNDSDYDKLPGKRKASFSVKKQHCTSAENKPGGPQKRKNRKQPNPRKKYDTRLSDGFSVANENIENEGSKRRRRTR